MSTKSREVIWGGQIMGAEIHTRHAREAAREADRAEAHAWSLRMEGWRAGAAVADNRAMPQWRLGVARSRVHHCKTSAGLPLDAILRPQHAHLEAGSGAEMPACKKGRYAPPIHMIKLTEEREIVAYVCEKSYSFLIIFSAANSRRRDHPASRC